MLKCIIALNHDTMLNLTHVFITRICIIGYNAYMHTMSYIRILVH